MLQKLDYLVSCNSECIQGTLIVSTLLITGRNQRTPNRRWWWNMEEGERKGDKAKECRDVPKDNQKILMETRCKHGISCRTTVDKNLKIWQGRHFLLSYVLTGTMQKSDEMEKEIARCQASTHHSDSAVIILLYTDFLNFLPQLTSTTKKALCLSFIVNEG